MNYKDIQTYLSLFVIITVFGVLYNRWEHKNLKIENKNTNHHIKQFLLNKNISNLFWEIYKYVSRSNSSTI